MNSQRNPQAPAEVPEAWTEEALDEVEEFDSGLGFGFRV